MHLDPIIVEEGAFVVHEFEIEQTERVYQLIHHVFLRLAKWGIASDEITLLEFFEYLAELAIVCQPRSLQQILSGHALPPILQGCDDGQMVVGLLEKRIEQAVELFGEFSATSEA